MVYQTTINKEGHGKMDKPRVFISSTIYDFYDLRSALKYWLSEAGYDAQLSEHPDFSKDSSLNSYDACLNSIHSCDYFILLIGGRRGGTLTDCDSISITRKEYREAYKLAMEEKIKIVTFLRKGTADRLHERESIAIALDGEGNENKKSSSSHFKTDIWIHPSEYLQDPYHTKNFIDEVTKGAEGIAIKTGYNWINLFEQFSDIITVLKNELGFNLPLSRMISKNNVEKTILRNMKGILQKFSYAKTGDDLNWFLMIREELYTFMQEHEKAQASWYRNITFTKSKAFLASQLVSWHKNGVDMIDSHAFEQALSSGNYFKYNREANKYEDTKFAKAFRDMHLEIGLLKDRANSIDNALINRIGEIIKGMGNRQQESYDFDVMDLLMVLSVYESRYNIVELSRYLLQLLRNETNELPYPHLLRGRAELSEERVNEREVYEFLNLDN
ncbi:MAG: DUF4062 domain-containing protein [Defluviitaleaceae bacterium]|nr:DUF4062 domain-containing protein [Defluviitaleaceae bacterium]